MQTSISNIKRDFISEHTALKAKIDNLKKEIKQSQVQLCWLNEELIKSQNHAHELIMLMVEHDEEFDKNMDLIIDLYK